jgi:hypothetical protein
MADKSNEVATSPERSTAYVPPNSGSWRIERERGKMSVSHPYTGADRHLVVQELALLPVLSEAQIEADKFYAQWAGGYVEVG